MDKELDAIAQVTSTGELRGKLLEADEAKVEIEAILLKRVKLARCQELLQFEIDDWIDGFSFKFLFQQNTLLQETFEEWEQCEKKLKDIRIWIDKTRGTVEAGQFKKKPLRDQLGLCEKYLAEINGQKTKITLSIEKLQVILLPYICLYHSILLHRSSSCHCQGPDKTIFVKHFIDSNLFPFSILVHFTRLHLTNRFISVLALVVTQR